MESKRRVRFGSASFGKIEEENSSDVGSCTSSQGQARDPKSNFTSSSCKHFKIYKQSC